MTLMNKATKILNRASQISPLSPFFDFIDLAGNLQTITNRDPNEETSLNDLYLTAKNVDNIWDACESLYQTGAHPAVMLCLRRKGKIVLNRTIGHARGNAPNEKSSDTQLATINTPVCLFSASKGFTAFAVHMLHDLGKINLDRPVAKYIPEFGKNGKDTITIRDVLQHRSGVPLLGEIDIEDIVDHDVILKNICDQKAGNFWKKRQSYHAITGGFIFDEVFRRVTGNGIDTFIDEYIRQPMGFEYFTYGLEKDKRHLVAKNSCAGKKIGFLESHLIQKTFNFDFDTLINTSNSEEYLSASLPSANMYATAEECSRFLQMTLDKGMYGNTKIMHPDTIKNVVNGHLFPRYDHILKLPLRFSDGGMMLGGAPLNVYGPFARSAYGHLGLMNNMCWADPERDISVALLTTGKAILGPHLVNFYNLIMTIANNCSKTNKK